MPRFYGNGVSVGPLGLILLGPFYLIVLLFTGFVRLLFAPRRRY